MAHPLDGAFLRVDRAEEHLVDLKARIFDFAQSERDEFAVELDPKHPEDFSKMTVLVPEESSPPGMLSVLSGEIVYNLRAALDYLIYALAELDSGSPKEGTQFPIADSPQRFAERRTFLVGLNADHIAAIERLQPYNGCQWTGRLRDLSNPDKHRHLVRLKGQFSVQLILSIGDLETVPGRTAVQSAYDETTGDTVHVQHQIEIRIAFNDGLPVVETLEILKSQVAETLKAFEPEF